MPPAEEEAGSDEDVVPPLSKTTSVLASSGMSRKARRPGQGIKFGGEDSVRVDELKVSPAKVFESFEKCEDANALPEDEELEVCQVPSRRVYIL